MYIPDGYGTVFPYMVVDDAETLMDFLTSLFGAHLLGKALQKDGRLANARIRIGTSCFMISQAVEGNLQAMPGTYYVYVEDVDETFRKAVALGAAEIFAPADMPYQDRQAGISDPCGNLWWISRRLVEEPYDPCTNE